MVGEEGKVDRAYVELGPVREDGMQIVEAGLAADQRVVINGIQRIRFPEQVVSPNEVSLDNGGE